MTRRIIGLTALLAAVLAVPATAQESLLQKLLRIAGLTAAPSQLRAPGDVTEGEIWIYDVRSRTARRVASDGLYRSPIFAPSDGALYALEADTLVRVGDNGVTRLTTLPGVEKLVGFDPEATPELVVLLDTGAGMSPLAAAALDSGATVPIPVDEGAAEVRQMLTYIRGEERVYGDVRLFTRSESRQGAVRAVEWTDVFLQQGTAPAVNVSNGAGVSAGQPALSPDGQRVAFIKAVP